MRGDYLETHMMRMDHLMCNNEGTGRKVVNEDNIVTKGLDDVGTDDNIVNNELDYGKTENNVKTNGENIRYTDEKFIAVKKRVFAELEEFDRKMELGRYVKLVVDKHGYNENGLGNDTKEALKT